ncbi:c-Myc-binding protein homolog [Cylas formicarius]|uniref:c-Myc-binding protein homolog n=1 Tax=Cylas formicarius TaxID=197179 RepID=UPI00295854B4|nr:c-Myc-binding protein homolog [Cylas formicarius]
MSANPSYKPSEGKREEFRKYLEKNGVMDALTKVLVNLYEEVDKPEDALEFIRDKLATIAGLEPQKQVQKKLDEANDRIKDLEDQLKSLSDKLQGDTKIFESDIKEESFEDPITEPEKVEEKPPENLTDQEQ